MDEIQKIIKQGIYIDIRYESGIWYYILQELPSEKDIAFANSGECQDGDLWLNANVINENWYEQNFQSYENALCEGVQKAKEILISNHN